MRIKQLEWKKPFSDWLAGVSSTNTLYTVQEVSAGRFRADAQELNDGDMWNEGLGVWSDKEGAMQSCQSHHEDRVREFFKEVLEEWV